MDLGAIYMSQNNYVSFIFYNLLILYMINALSGKMKIKIF